MLLNFISDKKKKQLETSMLYVDIDMNTGIDIDIGPMKGLK